MDRTQEKKGIYNKLRLIMVFLILTFLTDFLMNCYGGLLSLNEVTL